LLATLDALLADDGIPAQIRDEEANVQAETDRYNQIKTSEQSKRDDAKEACRNFDMSSGNTWWYWALDKMNQPLEEVVNDMYFQCVRSSPDYQDCQQCDASRTVLQGFVSDLADATEKKQIAESNLAILKQTLQEKTTERDEWRAKEPALKQTRDQKYAAWQPRETQCTADVDTYLTQLRAHMKSETEGVPSYYEQSCEYECIRIEKTRGEGCGVMEGNLPTDITGRGGIRNSCNPPATSFVTSPYTYGAEAETSFGQCNRIFAEQRPAHAQNVLKSGWLWKRGRNFQWQKRFFVLESGDQVRTGLLRYFLADPSLDRRAEERFDKTTILWDAEKVVKYDGSTYSWSDGSMCLSIVHFYRHIRLCVPGDGDRAKATQERDDWFKYLDSQLGQNRRIPGRGRR